MRLRKQFLLLLIISALLSGAAVSTANSLELSAEDRVIIETAAAKAEELDAELLPICQDPQEGFFIPPGYKFAIYKGHFAFKEGQLVVNVGFSPIFFGELALLRGEYALILYNGVVKKGDVSIEGPKGLSEAPDVKSGYTKGVQKVFFGNY